MLTKLKLVRLERGYKLWKVAGAIGCSESLISKWENGALCPEPWLKKLASFYGVFPEDLMEPLAPLTQKQETSNSQG